MPNRKGPCQICLAEDKKRTHEYANLGTHECRAHGIHNADSTDPSAMRLITQHVQQGMLARIDVAIGDGRAPNRSEFIRMAIAFYIHEIEHEVDRTHGNE